MARGLSQYEYVYYDANQRVRPTLADGLFWVYEFDRVGQVISGRKYCRDGSPVAGMQFTYGYDDIDNRTQSSQGGDANGENLRVTTYTASLLNTYTAISRPRQWTVQGVAQANATVTVPGAAVIRHREDFAAEVSASGTGALLQTASDTAHPPTGSD